MTTQSPDAAEQVAQIIEQYGEGLVPELRIVTNWLADYFRNDEDVRAALPSNATTNASLVEALREAREFIADSDWRATPNGGMTLLSKIDATLRASNPDEEGKL